MFWKKKELVEEEVLLETYRVRVYIKDREQPLEGIAKQEIVSDYNTGYGAEKIINPYIMDRGYAILKDFKTNIKHFIPEKEIRYIEDEMIYRTPATMKVMKEKKK